MKRYYLGKQGRAFGPYTETQIQQMKDNRKIDAFSYICSVTEGVQSNWLSLDPTPPNLDLQKSSKNTDSKSWLGIDRMGATILNPIQISSVGGSFLIHAQAEKLEAPLLKGQKIRICSIEGEQNVSRDGKILSILKSKAGWECEVAWNS